MTTQPQTIVPPRDPRRRATDDESASRWGSIAPSIVAFELICAAIFSLWLFDI